MNRKEKITNAAMNDFDAKKPTAKPEEDPMFPSYLHLPWFTNE